MLFGIQISFSHSNYVAKVVGASSEPTKYYLTHLVAKPSCLTAPLNMLFQLPLRSSPVLESLDPTPP